MHIQNMEEILSKYPDMEFVQLQIHYLDWEDPVIQSRKCYETARKYGCEILVMEPVKGGTLVNLPEEAGKLLRSVREELSSETAGEGTFGKSSRGIRIMRRVFAI